VSTPCQLPLDQIFEMGGALMMVTRTPLEPRARGRGGLVALPSRNGAAPLVSPASLALPTAPSAPARLPAGLARWRQRRRAEQSRLQVQHALRQRLPALLAREEADRRSGAPDACDLADRARLCQPVLWHRRRTDPDFLRLRLGWSDLPSRIRIDEPAGGDAELLRTTLRALLPAAPRLHSVPLTVDLPRLGILAVAGEPTATAP